MDSKKKAYRKSVKKVDKKIESDSWRVIWSEKDDNWISDGGTTYHKSTKELEEYVESVTSKNTHAYNMIPLFIDRWVEE